MRKNTQNLLAFIGILFGASYSISANPAATSPPPEIIQAILIEENGLGQIDESVLRNQLTIKVGDPYDPNRILNSRNDLLATGDFDAIDPLVEDSPKGPVVVLSLRTKPILADISFEGLNEMTRQAALDQIGLPLGKRTDPTQLSAAADRLAVGFADSGFLDATVKWKADPLPEGKVSAIFSVSSGEISRIGEIEVTGWPEMELSVPASVQSGSPFVPADLILLAESLEWQLRNSGYAFAHVDLSWTLPKDKRVNIKAAVKPGDRYVVNQILIEGLEVTDPRVAESVIGTVPNSLYSESSLQADRDRLLNRGMFGEAEVEALQSGPGEVDLIYRLQEKPSGRFLAGLEFGQDEGLAFVVELKERNFAFTPPFRGDGIEADIRAEIGDERLRLNTRAFQPSFRGGPWFYGIGAGAAQLEYLSDDYNQRQYGFDGFIGKTFAAHWSAALGYQYTHFEIYDVTANAAALIQEEEGVTRFAGPFAQLGYNTVAGTIRPESGLSVQARLSLGSDFFPGNTEVIGTTLGARWYTSPLPRQTLTIRGSFRTISPYGETERAPLPLREFLGGYNNLRGFDFRSVSPRNEEGDAIGGETSWYGSVEYAVPVPKVSFLDISAFLDVGLVGLESFDLGSGTPASNVGIGFLFRADNFPLRINLATPLTIPDNDPENKTGQVRVSFSAGFSF